MKLTIKGTPKRKKGIRLVEGPPEVAVPLSRDRAQMVAEIQRIAPGVNDCYGIHPESKARCQERLGHQPPHRAAFSNGGIAEW